MIFVQVVTRARTVEARLAFCRLLTNKLEAACGVAPSDVIVSLVSQGEADWSFGLRRRGDTPAGEVAVR